MMLETITIIAIVAAAAAFAAGRVWQTLRVARGQADCNACGGCKPERAANGR